VIVSGTIVCIHGAGGGGWEYAKWDPLFRAAGYRVIANDLVPGAAGLAATHSDDYLAQVKAWAPAGTSTVLVGASMGGILALQAAEAINPAALVLVNSVPPAGVGAPRRSKRYPPIVEWTKGSLAETRDALFDSDEATIEWAWPRWRDESGALLQEIAAGIAVQPPTCPVLVVLGTEDTDIPYQTGLALAEWAGADVHLYHAMSHVGPLLSRRAAEVAQAVVTWCQQRLKKN
jgi:pimeloyl-ACP methyl ester carboxylesterase